jgi:hypothetical protein
MLICDKISLKNTGILKFGFHKRRTEEKEAKESISSFLLSCPQPVRRAGLKGS